MQYYLNCCAALHFTAALHKCTAQCCTALHSYVLEFSFLYIEKPAAWPYSEILGRYPLAVRSMAHCLNYRQCLASKPATSLLGRVVSEMSVMAQNGQDCWLTRANKMAELLQTPNVRYSNTSGRVLLKHIQCKFQIFWRDEIKSSRLGPNGEQHNKLLTVL